MEKMKIQILEYFKGLEFEEDVHKYTFKSKPIKISVSGLIKNFYEPFDSYTVSLKIAERDGLCQKEILKGWDDEGKKGIKIGNKSHLFGEVYPFNRNLEPSTGFEEAIVKFWNDLPDYIVPVIMELRMFHKEFMFAGTADILLFNTITNTFIIGDYKTNKDLFKNYKGKENKYKGKMMTGVFSHLLDTPFNHYQLQLSFYQILFEQTGLKVSSRKLIWLLPDGTYNMYSLDDYTGVLKEQLKTIKI